MCAYACVCMCAHVFVRVYMYMCLCACVCVHMSVCMCMCSCHNYYIGLYSPKEKKRRKNLRAHIQCFSKGIGWMDRLSGGAIFCVHESPIRKVLPEAKISAQLLPCEAQCLGRAVSRRGNSGTSPNCGAPTEDPLTQSNLMLSFIHTSMLEN